jgi:hypothetical protein
MGWVGIAFMMAKTAFGGILNEALKVVFLPEVKGQVRPNDLLIAHV